MCIPTASESQLGSREEGVLRHNSVQQHSHAVSVKGLTDTGLVHPQAEGPRRGRAKGTPLSQFAQCLLLFALTAGVLGAQGVNRRGGARPGYWSPGSPRWHRVRRQSCRARGPTPILDTLLCRCFAGTIGMNRETRGGEPFEPCPQSAEMTWICADSDTLSPWEDRA